MFTAVLARVTSPALTIASVLNSPSATAAMFINPSAVLLFPVRTTLALFSISAITTAAFTKLLTS